MRERNLDTTFGKPSFLLLSSALALSHVWHVHIVQGSLAALASQELESSVMQMLPELYRCGGQQMAKIW